MVFIFIHSLFTRYDDNFFKEILNESYVLRIYCSKIQNPDLIVINPNWNLEL